MSLAERVRRALHDLGMATTREVADHLVVQSRREVNRVRGVISDLMRAGQVVVVYYDGAGPKKYCLGTSMLGNPGDKQAKLWHAMQIKSETGAFRAREVALLAGASVDYAKRYIRFLFDLGALDRPGEGLYQVPGHRRHTEAPHWSRRGEARKAAAPPADPCAGCGAAVKRILNEVRALIDTIVSNESQVMALIDEIEAGLPLERTGDGESADQV